MTANAGMNPLFPIFVKLHNLNLLLIGGGYVAMEKLEALLTNSPEAKIKLVGIEISDQVKAVLQQNAIPFEERAFVPDDLKDIDLAIVAINDAEISSKIAEYCKEKKVLTNVADKPALCDFYLGSVVQKGNLKIAISTNGKSPTIAKRIKEVLNDTIPDEMEDVLDNMQRIRNGLNVNFTEKVKQLNKMTSILAVEKQKRSSLQIAFNVISYIVAILFLMIAGYYVLSAIL